MEIKFLVLDTDHLIFGGGCDFLENNSDPDSGHCDIHTTSFPYNDLTAPYPQ